MRQIEQALVTVLAADAQLVALGVTGVWRGKAPEGSTYPLIVFSKASGERAYLLGKHKRRELVYMVKAIGLGDDQTAAGAIDERVDALLTFQPLNLSPHSWEATTREADIDFPESSDGVTFQHVGGTYRVRVTEA
jgi:hypothetical protein